MNYIRGAVNAISAPYQYYRDLPPINPSTLTGAIDVIVIQRLTDNGATELACSPFHVRFGKWQVLRPGEKKVNVFVNGKPIPFNMKIGEAGEAFFVFETHDDVPADLITSPILQPTIPSDAVNGPPEELVDYPRLKKDVVAEEEDQVPVEPDFLDLDAGSRNVKEEIRTTPSQRPSGDPLRERFYAPDINEQDQRVDIALRDFANEPHITQIEYHSDVTLDMEGYKSKCHDRERSEQPFASSSIQYQPSGSHFPLLNPSLLQTQSASPSPYFPSTTSSPSPSPPPSSSPPSSSYPPIRATSEPPPDTVSFTYRDTGPSSSSLLLPPTSSSILMDGGKPVINESVPSTLAPYPTRSPAKLSDQDIASTQHALPATTTKKFAKTLRLTSDQLKALNLGPGANTITFSLSATGAVAATARIFVWDSTDLVLISDIDGTITKSDGLGHVFAMIGRDWTHVGVAKLYTDIVRNGYRIMYLTSRAIGQADATRDYLKGIKQNNYQLPEGPVIMSPDRLMASLHREVIMRKPELFKMACLRDIQRLFGESARNPFYAGFGNRITDALSYRSVKVPSARIFTIDSSGEVKMELLELAGYKSSYIHMTDLVDQMFPPIHKKWTPEFTDFNYWKVPLQEYALPDLSPPSPTLSARSDTSNRSALTRLRNFSLGGNSARGGHINSFTFEAPAAANDASFDPSQVYRNSHLRQMSSFERLSSTLAFMTGINNGDGSRRSASPDLSSTYAGSDDEDGEESEFDIDGKPRTIRSRRRSMTSMPGTLDNMHFDMDEGDQTHIDHHDDESNDGEENDVQEEVEEEFDDDLLVAGAMKKVPFLYE